MVSSAGDVPRPAQITLAAVPHSEILAAAQRKDQVVAVFDLLLCV